MLPLKDNLQYFALLLLYTFVGSNEVQFVRVLYRHGDRTPTGSFPSDEIGPERWPDGYGQLTQLGMKQSYNLGTFIKERYFNTVVSERYSPKSVISVSSSKTRRLLSSYCCMAGLFPPSAEQQWDVDGLGTLWQPTIVETLSLEHEPRVSANVPCEKYDKLLEESMQSDAAKQFQEQYKNLISEVTQQGGWKSEQLSNLWTMYDSASGMKTHQKAHPAWITDNVFEELSRAAPSQLVLRNLNMDMVKLQAGSYVEDLCNDLEQLRDSAHNIALHSSHNKLMSAVLESLGAWNRLDVPFASAIFLEVHGNTSSFDDAWMEIWYKNDSILNHGSPPHLLSIEGCSEKCSLKTFLSLMEKFRLKDYDEECGNASPKSTSMLDFSRGQLAGVIIGILILVLLLVLVVTCVCYCVRKSTYKPAGGFIASSSDL